VTEHRGFECDGGCDSTVVLGPHDSLAQKGWYTVYGPTGSRTLHCCQPACVLAAMRTYHPINPAVTR
jgi:hypothetical protein